MNSTDSPEVLASRLELHKSLGYSIVSRKELADSLGLSPSRVSELVQKGVLEPVSTSPLRYSLEHSQRCYADYQWWLTVKRPGQRYAAG